MKLVIVRPGLDKSMGRAKDPEYEGDTMTTGESGDSFRTRDARKSPGLALLLVLELPDPINRKRRGFEKLLVSEFWGHY